MEKHVRDRQARSHLSRWFCTKYPHAGIFYFTAVGSLLAVSAVATAAELPDDVWSGKYGGMPSVTVDANGKVSMELPAEAIVQAGGGSVAGIAKDFLEKWASGACFAIFDFQAPHKNLKVQIALLQSAGKFVFAGAPGTLFTPSGYIEVEIDYDPKNVAKCAAPGA